MNAPTLTAAAATPADFAASVLAGLRQPQKVIPARWFYDHRGSQLFEAITQLPEYYLTRAEIGLLKAHGADIAALVGPGRAVVEFGAGSSAKTPLLLGAIAPAAYVPVDISAEFLAESSAALALAHPGLNVVPLVADFTRPWHVPEEVLSLPQLGFFSGSTLGNCTPAVAVDLLRQLRAGLGEDALMLIGLDVPKDRSILEPAYDDAQGVTALFNLNLVRRLNAELDGDLSEADFEHRAPWNADQGRIEMHLVARRDIAFTVAGERFAMRAGETIHTENSYKWTVAEARLLARAAGWEPVALWLDPSPGYGLHLWRAMDGALEP
jgi:dimethylhistidine N-methyltransferase